MSDVTIFHNPGCGTSRNTLALIRKLPPFRKEDGDIVEDSGKRR